MRVHALAITILGITLLTACTSGTSGVGSTRAGTGVSSPGTTGGGSTGTATPPGCAGACLTDPASFPAVLDAAKDDVKLALSYDYRTLDTSHASAIKVMTPSFLTEFETTWSLVKQAAPEKRAIQNFSASTAGLVAVSDPGREEKVLLFGQTSFQDATTTRPRTDLATTIVTLQYSGGLWKIAELTVGEGADSDAASFGSAQLQAAVASAQREARNLTTYTRASFDTDYRRTVAGTTGALLDDLSDASRRDQLLSQMTRGHFDLQGSVQSTAVEDVKPDQVVALVLIDSKQLPDGKPASAPTTDRFELTLVKSGTNWLASELMDVGIR